MQSLKTGKDLMHWLANVDEDGIAWLHLKTDGKPEKRLLTDSEAVLHLLIEAVKLPAIILSDKLSHTDQHTTRSYIGLKARQEVISIRLILLSSSF